MPTCLDTEHINYGANMKRCDFDYRMFRDLGQAQVGIDLEPAQIAIIPQQYILPRMKSDLANLNPYQAQPYMWPVVDEYGLSSSRTFRDGSLSGVVGALPQGTTTGVLREHIMRLNSSASCVSLEASAFPATCSGADPFQASLEYKGLYQWGTDNKNISTIEICAPGDLGKTPWTLSRNRQDLSEEVFLRIKEDRYDDEVLHCTGRTTRGYFELGNVHNGDVYGPLLEKWPGNNGSSLAEHHFNDYMKYDWGSDGKYSESGYLPSEE